MSEPSIWRPTPRRVNVLELLGAPLARNCRPLAGTRWLARFAGVRPVGRPGHHPVRELWLPAAAGGVAVAFVAMSAVAAAGTLAAVGGGGFGATTAGLVWGGLMTVVYRAVLRDGPRHQARWRRAVTLLWAAAVGVVAAAPLGMIGRFGSLASSGAPGQALADSVTLAGTPTLVALAVLPVPTLWRRRAVAVPAAGDSVYVTQLPSPRTIHVGPAARASLWLGGQRDDVAGRWPVADRLHHVRAGMVGSCLLVGVVAAGTAVNAASNDVVAAMGGGVLWGWVCAAVARHHLVVSDDATGRCARHSTLSSGVVSVLVGLITGSLLSIGMLTRMVPLSAGATGLGRFLPLAAEPGGVAQWATLTFVAFSVFVQLLPVLPWPPGDVLAVQQRLLVLLDIATLSADRDQEEEYPAADDKEAAVGSKGVNRE